MSCTAAAANAHISGDEHAQQGWWTRTTGTVDTHSSSGGRAQQWCQREQHEEDETTTHIGGDQ
ncbi:hypothetical protein DEO72_LG8g2782 [Vigna unguiculata]|uniref:Uncharacterized protein n=1 Tax=Vigna unguiculata TaxID=3917 RepID=A0A4D6LED3_VIGUN|nr:hypothetical protein DEO72_LG3g1210 [Vigna unguiculata]QCE04744.1 hypothetical protein DEO72_LG8g2782 [Vigna unguiculata]